MVDIVISEFMNPEARAGLAADFEVRYEPDLVDRPDDLAAAVATARALIVRNRTQVRDELLAAGPKLEAVGRLGVGLDNIDLAACAARGVTVCPATGANAISVAECAITAAMILLRGAYMKTSEVIAGTWPRDQSAGREIWGKTLGIVGLGSIGRQTALRGRALGMTVVACDPLLAADDEAWALAEPMAMMPLLAASDVVSLHVPLLDTTRRLIDAQALAAMKPDAVLINTARGGVLDEAALIEALRGSRLGGAALDVFADEPVTAASGRAFAEVPNLMLTPHIAGVTQESNLRVGTLVAEKVRAVLEAGT